jgi:hypothetical protein
MGTCIAKTLLEIAAVYFVAFNVIGRQLLKCTEGEI